MDKIAVRVRGPGQWIAAATVLVFPSLYSFQFMSFAHAKLAGLAVGCVLLACYAPKLRRDPIWIAPALWILWGAAVALARGPGQLPLVSPLVAQQGLVLVAAILLSGPLRRGASQGIELAIAASALPVAALALGQYAGLLDFLFPAYPGYDQRMYSVFGNQDLLGAYLAITLALVGSLWFARRVSTLSATLAALVIAPALFLSGSRTAWLAALCGAAVSAALSRKEWRRIVAALILLSALAAAAVAVAPGATWRRVAGSFALGDAGYGLRLWIWDGTLRLVAESPLAGAGTARFPFAAPEALGDALVEAGPGVHVFNHLEVENAHSDYLHVLAETGAIGAALLLYFFISLPRSRHPAWPGLASALVFSVFNSTLHSPPHLLAVLLLGAALRPDASDAFVRAPRRLLIGATGILAFGVAAGVLWPSALHAHARRANAAEFPLDTETRYRLAARFDPTAMEDLAVVLANAGERAEALSTAQAAARYTDGASIHYLLARFFETSDPRRAEAHYRAALERWPDHAPALEGLLRVSAPEEREVIVSRYGPWMR